MIIACRCGQKNRVPDEPTKSRIYCGKCRHDLTTRAWIESTVSGVKARRMQDFADALDAVWKRGK